MQIALILLAAVFLDWIFGDPVQIPHPIIGIGKWIHQLEKWIRRSGMNLKFGGFLLLILATGTVAAVITGLLFLAQLIHPVLKLLLTVYLLYTSLAAKCLRQEVMKVCLQLRKGDLQEARRFISYLVGRDTANLTEAEITRAAVETAAENTVDGVLAPLFYILIGLLLGIPVQMVYLYKTINTLDSMVGYIQEPYREIGYFSAKTDDLANYLPARFGALLMVLAGGMMGYDAGNGMKILIRDRRNHKSPNCGYPESAAAGLLNIRIGGTNTYFDQVLVKPTLGDANREMTHEDIGRTIRIMYGAQVLQLVISLLLIWIVTSGGGAA